MEEELGSSADELQQMRHERVSLEKAYEELKMGMKEHPPKPLVSGEWK